jgi:hypothetical protein
MTLEVFQTVFYTVGFIVPGFILDAVIASLHPSRGPARELAFLRFLTYSCFNYAFWSWLIYLVFATSFRENHPGWAAAAWAGVIFVGPVVLGLVIALVKGKGVVRRTLQKLGFNPIHAIPTGWDYAFGKVMRDPVWVAVTFKSGKQVVGFYGPTSFASSVPGERDIYLQEILHHDSEGHLVRNPRSLGMLIPMDQVRWMEFLTVEKESIHGRQSPEEATQGRLSTQG